MTIVLLAVETTLYESGLNWLVGVILLIEIGSIGTVVRTGVALPTPIPRSEAPSGLAERLALAGVPAGGNELSGIRLCHQRPALASSTQKI